MVLLNIMMPRICTECPVRMECKVYCHWLTEEKRREPPKPRNQKDCMLHDASEYMKYLDDGK